MLLYINLIIQIGSASPTLLVDLPVFSALAFGKTNPAWQVKISCGKKIVIDQPVESAFTDHNGIPVVLEDMVEGLPFQDQRGDDRIQMPDFIFGKRSLPLPLKGGSCILPVQTEPCKTIFPACRNSGSGSRCRRREERKGGSIFAPCSQGR